MGARTIRHRDKLIRSAALPARATGWVIALLAAGAMGSGATRALAQQPAAADRQAAPEPKADTPKPDATPPNAAKPDAPKGDAAAKPEAPKWKPSAPGRAAKKPKLPVTITVSAPSPDPPWLVHIENTSDVAVRIPADMRLLSFDLKSTMYDGKTQNPVKKCVLPRSMAPRGFPATRELYLEPGEFYEEQIDPRLYCFGDSIDLLRPGSIVKPHFGFGGATFSAKEPFAAQGTDRPEAYEAQKEIVGAEVVLPPLPKPLPPATTAPEGTPASPPKAPKAALKGEPESPTPPTASKKDPDRNRGDIDIYVSRTSDAGAPRDVTLTIRAVNEGKRQLAAVLRGRMLQFVVEELAPDNTARRRVECAGQNAPHGIASEMVGEVRPGREVQLPLLVAEMCPRGTFPKPGLYRVMPVLDASMSGESLQLDPWLGTALAMQSTLARVATARDPYYDEKPAVGPLQTSKPNDKPSSGKPLDTKGAPGSVDKRGPAAKDKY